MVHTKINPMQQTQLNNMREHDRLFLKILDIAKNKIGVSESCNIVTVDIIYY